MQQRVDRAMAAAVKFLLAQIGQDGRCKGDFPPGNPRFGGKTALCAYALLTAGADARKEPALRRAIQWLEQAKLQGTYAVAMRACAFASWNDPNARTVLEGDVQWLIRAADQNGGYTYTSRDGGPAEEYDNSNAHVAALGVWTGATRGVEVPPAYWRAIEKHWTAQQQVDGGWGYRIPPKAMQTRSYGSMTAAGLATLLVCLDNLRQEDFVRCTASGETKPIADSLKWLEKNFSASENPGKGVEWYYYWLYCLQRVGLASGLKSFGRHDWYVEGAAALLARQNDDGSWYYDDRSAETSFALLFLARGSGPILAGKLRYPGKWNARPRDAANLTRWLFYTFERPINWQIVDIDAMLSDWHDAPILYVSGAGPFEVSDAQSQKMRDFVFQGGLILSEAAGNNGDFTLDVQKLHQRLFPAYPLRRLPDDHPLYSIQYAVTNPPGLLAVSNGVRLLAIHAPKELSLALQTGPREANRETFELLANVYMFTTDKDPLRPRGVGPWPTSRPFVPAATIRLARVRCGENCDPEPLAFQRLAVILGNEHNIKLESSEPVEPSKLDPVKWPVAHLTGTGDFKLAAEDAAALKKYLLAGGTLVIDAAGGAEAFADAADKQIMPLVGERRMLNADHPLYLKGPYRLDKVAYRRGYAATLDPSQRDKPMLECAEIDRRTAIVFSREDLTAGLAGCTSYGIRGYTSQSAVAVMTNILCHAAGVKKQ
jgi:hypothetical protein